MKECHLRLIKDILLSNKIIKDKHDAFIIADFFHGESGNELEETKESLDEFAEKASHL